MTEKLEKAELTELFTEVELPLIDVLVELEYNGIKIDSARLAELSEEYGRRLETLEEEIHDLAGRKFNIASPKQLQEILFTELKLPVLEKDAENRSQHRCRSARRTGPAASAAGQAGRVSAVRQAEKHVRRCPADDGPSARPAEFTLRSIRWWRRPAD